MRIREQMIYVMFHPLAYARGSVFAMERSANKKAGRVAARMTSGPAFKRGE